LRKFRAWRKGVNLQGPPEPPGCKGSEGGKQIGAAAHALLDREKRRGGTEKHGEE